MQCLIGVSNTGHSTHDSQHVVVNSVHSDLSSVNTGNSSGRKDKLENSIVDSGEVARPAGLMFLGAKSKGVHVDAAVRGAGVVLERLNNVEVRPFTFREAVLAVKLEFSGDDGVLAPAVHVQGSLGKHEGAGIGQQGPRCTGNGLTTEHGGRGVGPVLVSGVRPISTPGHLEKTRCVDEGVSTRGLGGSTEGVDGVGQSIDGVGVVEGLGTEGLEEDVSALER